MFSAICWAAQTGVSVARGINETASASRAVTVALNAIPQMGGAIAGLVWGTSSSETPGDDYILKTLTAAAEATGNEGDDGFINIGSLLAPLAADDDMPIEKIMASLSLDDQDLNKVVAKAADPLPETEEEMDEQLDNIIREIKALKDEIGSGLNVDSDSDDELQREIYHVLNKRPDSDDEKEPDLEPENASIDADEEFERLKANGLYADLQGKYFWEVTV